MIQQFGSNDFVASFHLADISMTDSTRDYAYEALVTEIFDTLDVLLEEPRLCPDAAEQLQTLLDYILKEEDADKA